MIEKEAKMLNYNDRDKPSQTTFIHYAFKMAVEQINTLSDCLMAIQPSKYEVEKDIMRLLQNTSKINQELWHYLLYFIG